VRLHGRPLGELRDTSMTTRPAPTSLQAEPRYPDHDCVCFCLSAPDWTCHFASARCQVEEPHLISECGEFDPIISK
jgi:hypothetical protein